MNEKNILLTQGYFGEEGLSFLNLPAPFGRDQLKLKI